MKLRDEEVIAVTAFSKRSDLLDSSSHETK